MPYKDPNDPRLKASRKRYYDNNKSQECKRVIERKRDLRKFVNNLKEQRGCHDCGEKHPACLDWHHDTAVRENKQSVAGFFAGKGWSKERILTELEKGYIVLCANCHRKIHWQENNRSMVFNGSTGVSKAFSSGSNPDTPAYGTLV